MNPFGAVLCVVAAFFVVWLALRLTVLKRGFMWLATQREKRFIVLSLAVLLGVNWVYLLVTRAATS